MDQQAQYKEAIRLLNADLKDLREKLEEAGRQKEKLEGELTALRKQVETAGTNAVQNSRQRSHSSIPVLSIMALGSMIVLSKLR